MIYKNNPKITTIVLHHTAVSRSIQPIQLKSVDSYHKSKWNFVSELGYYIGYNFVVEPTGLRTQTRKVGEETIAQIGNNCDVPERCGMISYCMVGDFRVEKPTQMQISDFRNFVKEVRELYPHVVVKQHKDVYPSRTCAELSQTELDNILSDKSKDEIIEELTLMVNQLIALVTKLLAWKTK